MKNGDFPINYVNVYQRVIPVFHSSNLLAIQTHLVTWHQAQADLENVRSNLGDSDSHLLPCSICSIWSQNNEFWENAIRFGKFFGKLTPLTQNWPRQHDSIAPEGGVSTSGWGAADFRLCMGKTPSWIPLQDTSRMCTAHVWSYMSVRK